MIVSIVATILYALWRKQQLAARAAESHAADQGRCG
jgi:hypothetical protein